MQRILSLLTTDKLQKINAFVIGIHQEIFYAVQDNNVYRLELDHMAVQTFLVGHSKPVVSLLCLPNGNIVTGSMDTKIILWNGSTGQKLISFKGHSRTVLALAYSMNYSHLLSYGEDNVIRAWHIDTGKCTLIIDADIFNTIGIVSGQSPVQVVSKISLCLEFLNEGYFANGTNTGQIEIRDLKTYKIRDRINTGASINVLKKVTLNWLACALDNHTIQIWDYQQSKPIQTLKGHKDAVTALQLITVDYLLASGSNDTTIKIWDIITGDCLITLTGHTGKITELKIVEDGQLLSASEDGSFRLWRFNKILSPLHELDKVATPIDFFQEINSIIVNIQPSQVNALEICEQILMRVSVLKESLSTKNRKHGFLTHNTKLNAKLSCNY